MMNKMLENGLLGFNMIDGNIKPVRITLLENRLDNEHNTMVVISLMLNKHQKIHVRVQWYIL
jgi:hypothetical protein